MTLQIFKRLINRFSNNSYCRLNFEKHRLKCYFSSISNSVVEGESEDKVKTNSELQDLLDDSSMGSGPLDEIDENDEWRTSPYPRGSVINPKQSQSLRSLRPKTDPQHTSIILFPGQGSQYVGMGQELLQFPAARDLIDAACEILKYDLLKLMLKGPKEKLDQTVYSQPAVVVCSLASLEKLKEERPSAIETCIGTAGFGVGEITALTFAGVFKFSDAIKLVRTRAEAMQLASELVPGGMATIIYGAESKLNQALLGAKEWCLDKGIDNPECRISTYLNPNMKLVSGHIEALKYLEYNKSFFKLNDVKRIASKGGFHSNLMLPAAPAFRKKLRQLEIMESVIPVYSTVNGTYYDSTEHIKSQLPKQIYKPIKWEQMMHILYERDPNFGFPNTIVCGPPNPLKQYLSGVNLKAAKFCHNITALEFLETHKTDFKLRNVLRIPVSGAFHSELMKPAAEPFKVALNNIEMFEPSAYVYSNVDARTYGNLKLVKQKLPKQIYKPVRWLQVIQRIYNRQQGTNFPSTFTCGPGSSLKTMITNINVKASRFCVNV